MTRVLSIAAVVLVAAVPAAAATWTVGSGNADFPLIAPAVAAAAAGDVIVVRRGVYREHLVLDRRVAIVGEGWPVLYGTGTGSVIRIIADDCEVRGLAIELSGAGETNEMDAAVQILSNRNRILQNRMRRVFYGVVVAGGAANDIAGNEIEGFLDRPFGRRGDGVYVYRGAGNRVTGNRVSGERDGIYLQYAPGGTVEGNTVERSRYGLHVMFSEGALVRDNSFSACAVGANIMNSRAIQVTGNRVFGNRGAASAGLSLKQCDGSTLRGNTIADNARGLQLDGSSENRFIANRFTYNDTAVVLLASAEENVFTENEFDRNWSDVVADGRNAGAAWSAAGRGNRWSAYEGVDIDGDGVGDVAHPLLTPFARFEAANPLARLFLQTPAAGALALVARAGLGDRSGLLDPAPLAGRVAETGAAESHPDAAAAIALATAALAVLLRREVSACSN